MQDRPTMHQALTQLGEWQYSNPGFKQWIVF